MSTREADNELINRMIDPEIGSYGGEFITNNEFLAYAQHLSDRELVDTEANRATWIAARTYYDAEATEAEGSDGVIGIDREAEQERLLGQHDDAIQNLVAQLSDLRFRLNEDRVKEMALSMAVQNSSADSPTSIVAKAKAFEAFLSGKES